MTDPAQEAITALDEKRIDRDHAIPVLTGQIIEAYPGVLDESSSRKVEVFVARIVADVESGTIDTSTAVTSIVEARDLAKAGVGDFVDLIQIGAE